MTITTPALAVHYRLMQQLPVRTHKRPPEIEDAERRNPQAALTAYRRRMVAGWLAMPKRERPALHEMGRRLDITKRSVVYHVQAIRNGRRKVRG